jgi:nucleotide-binding universal stress UspA family protein
MRLEYHNPALPILTERFADLAVESPRWDPDADDRERGVILHPTDYSAAARHAFELACRLARSRASRLLVLHVAEPLRSPALGLAPAPDLPRGYRGAWESQLALVRPSEADVPVERRLEEGDAATEILRVARETSTELIVMGTGGRARWLPGSVARTVSRHALCPVLALNAPAGDGRSPRGEAPRRVLHPTDFSISSRYALDVARCLVRDSGGELVIVHVASVPLLQSKRGYQAEMEEALRRLAESDPDVPACWQLRVGGAAVQIAQAARDHSCDLIVMGAADRSLLGRLNADSAARHVEQEVPCPVAAVQCPSVGGRRSRVRGRPAPLLVS